MTIPTAYKRLSDARATPRVPRLGWAAGLAEKLLTSLTVLEVDWDALASRPRAGLLIYHFSTSSQATMAGRAYRDHGKPAIGRSEGAPSAERGLVYLGTPARERGQCPNKPSLAMPCIVLRAIAHNPPPAMLY